MYVRPLYFALRQFTVLENWRHSAIDGTYPGYPAYLWYEENEVKTVTIIFKVA